MRDQAIEERLRCGPRIIAIAITRLFRKGEAVQPVEQILSRCGKHAILREMDMGIDEARQDQAVAEIIRRDRHERLAARAASAPRPQDAAVITDDNRTLRS